jgi:hypothetical protein
MPRPEVLRVIAGTIALIGALIGLISRLDTTPPTVVPAAAPAVDSPLPGQHVPKGYDIQFVYYGALSSPAALHRGSSPSQARSVCTDQVRYEPNHGMWRCNGSNLLGRLDIGRPARDPGGPCTHRKAGIDSPAWSCLTKIAVPPAARNNGPVKKFVIFGGRRNGSDFCDQESRDNQTHGTWTCTNWRPFPAGFHLIPAIAQPGPCSFRVADQQTGIWTCNPKVP